MGSDMSAPPGTAAWADGPGVVNTGAGVASGAGAAPKFTSTGAGT